MWSRRRQLRYPHLDAVANRSPDLVELADFGNAVPDHAARLRHHASLSLMDPKKVESLFAPEQLCNSSLIDAGIRATRSMRVQPDLVMVFYGDDYLPPVGDQCARILAVAFSEDDGDVVENLAVDRNLRRQTSQGVCEGLDFVARNGPVHDREVDADDALTQAEFVENLRVWLAAVLCFDLGSEAPSDLGIAHGGSLYRHLSGSRTCSDQPH